MINPASVQRPSRYIDHELNVIRKESGAGSVSMALAFPDIYDIGMSHLGMKVLYQIVNAMPIASAERVFHPWLDMEQEMRDKGEPLRSLEGNKPLGDFDLVGFSLQYELAYTSMLNMLDLGGIPIRSSERKAGHPIVIAGGPCTVNPMPMAPFIDAALVGDGEEAVPEILEVIHGTKGSSRDDILKALSKIEGVYVPSIHTSVGSVKRRMIASLEDAPYPTSPVVPFTSVVHDRIAIEVSRGCTMGCRFCQAGMIYRPLRERTPETIMKIAKEALKNTGHNEVAFTSLSAGDYTCMRELISNFNASYRDKRISVSLPSLRVAAVNQEVLQEIRSVRKTGFTIAPEAATERLRGAINKDFSDADFDRAVETLFGEGWLNLKLYYMIGLPTETDADVEAIPDMILRAQRIAKRLANRGVKINVSVSPFVPKAHTPFQREGFAGLEYMKEKRIWLRQNMPKRATYKGHDERTSMLEAAFARAGVEAAELVEAAWRQGARLDPWSEAFDMDIWSRAQEDCGIDAEALASRRYEKDDELPWEIIDTGISRKYFEREYDKALKASITKDCSKVACADCGLGCKSGASLVDPNRIPVSVSRQQPQSPIRNPIRVRAMFEKVGMLRFLSHRELITALERALRRADVALEFSQGFHPQPKLSLGPPLSVGFESIGEYLDMEILPLRPLTALMQDINDTLPEGIKMLAIEAIEKREDALQAFIKKYVYEITGADVSGVSDFIAQKQHIIERKGKPLDIRPMFESMDVVAEDGKPVRITVRDLKEKGVKLTEMCEALFGVPATELGVRRIAMYGQSRGQWRKPMQDKGNE